VRQRKEKSCRLEMSRGGDGVSHVGGHRRFAMNLIRPRHVVLD
jgi:hypothetical protein